MIGATLQEKKGMKALELGITAVYVADAIRTYRQNQNLTYAELEQRLTDSGHRIPALGLRRIESQARRVDVDDLMALSAALNVSPMRLLLHTPSELSGIPHQVATGLSEDVPWNEAAAWVRDETGLTLRERIDFWRRQVKTLERLVDEGEDRVRSLREQLTQDPDPVLIDRLHWAEGEVSMSVESHARAVALYEELNALYAETQENRHE